MARPQMIYFCVPGRSACEKGRRSPDSGAANRHFITWQAHYASQRRAKGPRGMNAQEQVEPVQSQRLMWTFQDPELAKLK